MRNLYQILIVENNVTDRKLLKKILTDMNAFFDVQSVSSGKEMMEEIGKRLPDLILLDGDDFELLNQFNQKGYQNIPVILISSLNNEKIKDQWFESGVTDFINKPIAMEDVTARVAVQLRIKKILDDTRWASQKTNEGIRMLYKELEKKNEKLKEFDDLKDEFVGIVSHELRAPLAIIRESISQVSDGLFGAVPEKQKKNLDKSLVNIDRLNSIIDNLLDIAKLEGKRLEIFKESIDMIALVKEICDNFSAQVQSKNLELRCQFLKEPIEIFADKNKLIQVFTNLLNNALKFTEKGFIEISVRDTERNMECSIVDTGKGIAKEDLPKMFNKFEQVGRTHGPGQKGTGLGLSICKGIIELHNGHIKVESALNKGTEFTFTLPKCTANELLRETVKKILGLAVKDKTPFSILLLTVKKIDKEHLSPLLSSLEKLVNQCLHRRADLAIKDTNAIYVILPEASKENAQIVAQRIKKAIDENQRMQEFKNLSEFILKIYSYPKDGRSEEELIGGIEEQIHQ